MVLFQKYRLRNDHIIYILSHIRCQLNTPFPFPLLQKKSHAPVRGHVLALQRHLRRCLETHPAPPYNPFNSELFIFSIRRQTIFREAQPFHRRDVNMGILSCF